MPSILDMINQNRGDTVDIYVGPEKIHYNLPKKLLCSNSRYFDRCFNGPFMEGQTQTLVLDEDKVSWFEVLLQFMYHGAKISTDALKVTRPSGILSKQAAFGEYISFLAYVDKYDLREAGVAMLDNFNWFIRTQKFLVGGSHIESLFQVTAADSPYRSLITQILLKRNTFDTLIAYRKQELEVNGFAQELLAQMRSANASGSWKSLEHRILDTFPGDKK